MATATVPNVKTTPKAALSKLRTSSNRYHKLRGEYRDLRATIDKQVLDAKNAKATYREIAEATGMSVAWVQSSLLRSTTGGPGK